MHTSDSDFYGYNTNFNYHIYAFLALLNVMAQFNLSYTEYSIVRDTKMCG